MAAGFCGSGLVELHCAGASVSVDGLQVRELLFSLVQRSSKCSRSCIYVQRRAEASDVRFSALLQQAPESVGNLRGSGRHLIEFVLCDGDVISEGEHAEVDVLCTDDTAQPSGGTQRRCRKRCRSRHLPLGDASP